MTKNEKKRMKGEFDIDKHVKVCQTDIAQCERIDGSLRKHMGINNYGHLD